jgi:pimeloyl-ACP methyl ester carboxylesterase
LLTFDVVPFGYERRGAGPPLVLLHGAGHRWQAWEPVLDRLAAERDVIAVDLPGFGRSPLPDGLTRFDVPSAIGLLHGFFDQLRLERPHVAGNSMGGALALELADHDLVRAATAISPAGFWTPRQRAYALAVLRAGRALTQVPEAALLPLVGSPLTRTLSCGLLWPRPERLDPRTLLEDAAAMRRAAAFAPALLAARSYEFRGRPSVPVTIAWGTRDRILHPRQAERARRRLPEARHVTLPGCGHVPMHDDPELVARVILDGSRDHTADVTAA